MTRRRSLFLTVAAATSILLSACTATFGKTSASVTTGSAAGSAVTEATASPGSSAATSSDPVVRVVQSVEPAVVNVTATGASTNPFFGASTQKDTGSGFIVAANGVIFTNDHVIEGASSVTVTLVDGRTFPAKVIDTNPTHDFAVLKIDATGLPTVTLGRSSSLQLGESVVAFGYALGLSGGPTVTSGIISSLARTVQAQDPNTSGGVRTYRDALQTSAAINPGNSGGPLVDLQGNVIGIDTAGVSSADNIGFAIAIDAARSFIRSAVAAA